MGTGARKWYRTHASLPLLPEPVPATATPGCSEVNLHPFPVSSYQVSLFAPRIPRNSQVVSGAHNMVERFASVLQV